MSPKQAVTIFSPVFLNSPKPFPGILLNWCGARCPAKEHMITRPRLPFDIYAQALTTLEQEPGPLTPEKAELMHFLRARISDYSTRQSVLATLQPGQASNKRPQRHPS